MHAGGGPVPSVGDPGQARSGNADWLSLALIDARNRTLGWLAWFEEVGLLHGGVGHEAVPLTLAGRAGWFQEFWIARHVQRHLGEAADVRAPRLASVEPMADAWFAPAPGLAPGAAPPVAGDPAATVRGYLADTLETTLELLGTAAASDEALHVYRLALLHEDRLAEDFATAAQWLGAPAGAPPAPCAAMPARAQREPLWLPARTFELGSARGGLVPPNERWAHPVDVPAFEIDAQAVSWARLVEFAQDGGYDDARHWSAEGWEWLQGQERRAPRGVEQLRGAVLVARRGQLQRAPANQAVAHVSWHEAQAWCAWAGRRLPTEVEWELAACTAASRGFVWGDVREWVAGTARLWAPQAAAVAGVAGFSPLPPPGARRVLRGASAWTAPRCAHPKARRFAAPERDELPAGFRSCAI